MGQGVYFRLKNEIMGVWKVIHLWPENCTHKEKLN